MSSNVVRVAKILFFTGALVVAYSSGTLSSKPRKEEQFCFNDPQGGKVLIKEQAAAVAVLLEHDNYEIALSTTVENLKATVPDELKFNCP